MSKKLDDMVQWEVEKSLGELIEGIQKKQYKAAGLEWSAQVLRDEAAQMAKTLALYRQRLGLPYVPIGQPLGRAGDERAHYLAKGADPLGFEPSQLPQAGE